MKALRLILISLCLGMLAGSVGATEGVQEYTGTLKKVRASGSITIAYREASVPFSYLSARGEPIGYAIDICRFLVDAVSDDLGRPVNIKWLPVTSETRFSALQSGAADIECGSTTNNVERQKIVAFSPITFIAGTKLLVKKGSPIKSFRDLGGKTVVVTQGTTNEKTMRDLQHKFAINFNLVVARDHGESFDMVASGKVDTFATDDVLLYGWIAKNQAKADYAVVGDFLSYDPYGIVYRKGDSQLRNLIDENFRKLAQEGELEHSYNKWFLRRLPSGERIDMPMSPQLDTIFRSLTIKPE